MLQTPRLPRSIATVCLSGNLVDKLEAAAAAGFDGVEIFENDLLTFEGSPAEVRRLAEDLGLAITIFHPPRDFEAMPEPQRGRRLRPADRTEPSSGPGGPGRARHRAAWGPIPPPRSSADWR